MPRLCSLVLLPLVFQLSCAANSAENIFCYQPIYPWELHLLCAQYLLFFPLRGKQKTVRTRVLDQKSVRNAAGLLWLITQGSTARKGHAWWSWIEHRDQLSNLCRSTGWGQEWVNGFTEYRKIDYNQVITVFFFINTGLNNLWVMQEQGGLPSLLSGRL